MPRQSRAVKPVCVGFRSGGARVQGRFFPATCAEPLTTLLLVPGFPGNPDDVLGLGRLLAGQGVNVLMFNPRGLHGSEGAFSHANTIEDIGAALRWLERPESQKRFQVDATTLTLGGYSHGGGMALAYAASDPSVNGVISIAGTDHGEFIREFQRNEQFAEMIRKQLLDTRVPNGPARFDDLEAGLQELADHQDVYGLRENAANLADRSILLIGGWEDVQITVDQFLLPLYRALKEADAADVTFLVYHDDHDFGTVRVQVASDIRDWLVCSISEWC